MDVTAGCGTERLLLQINHKQAQAIKSYICPADFDICRFYPGRRPHIREAHHCEPYPGVRHPLGCPRRLQGTYGVAPMQSGLSQASSCQRQI